MSSCQDDNIMRQEKYLTESLFLKSTAKCLRLPAKFLKPKTKIFALWFMERNKQANL